MKRKKNLFKHRLEDITIGLVVLLIRPFGFRGAQRIGAFLGTVWYRVYRRRVDVSRENIVRAFGSGLGEKRIGEIIHNSYRNLGMTFLEFACFPFMTAADAAMVVRFDRPEVFDQLMKDGKGAILVTGHFGNWELLGAAVSGMGYPLSFVVGRQGNKYVDRRVNRYRARMGVGIIYQGAALRQVPRVLERKEFIALLTDQDARRSGVFVDFLGTPASTPKGAAWFSYKTGAPIIFAGGVRLPDGTHLARLTDPIRPRPEAPEEEEVLRLTQAYTDCLAEEVRRSPDQYFWPHRRWKTKPPDGRSE